MSDEEVVAAEVAASLSVYAAMDRRLAMLEGIDLPERCQGAVVMADISGFTPLTEKLVKTYGARRGGEEMTLNLNRVYGAMIDQVHAYRGSVLGFSGDAITCWFDGDDGSRAMACGIRLQDVFSSTSETNPETDILAIKVSVALGPARRFVVGEPSIRSWDVLSGDVVDRCAVGETLASAGDVVVCEALTQSLEGLEVSEWRRTPEGERFAVIERWDRMPSPSPWPEAKFETISASSWRPWLLRPVYEGLFQGQRAFLANLRVAVPLFLRFRGIDFDSETAIEHLDAYTCWVEEVLEHHGGSLIQLTVGDKGSYLYAVFGAPMAHEDSVERALGAALVLRDTPEHLSFVKEVQIGISQGQMRTGAYGSVTRRTYGVLGDETNVAARLMSSAKPSEVLVTARVAKRGTDFSFQPMNRLSVKGKKEAIAVSALTGLIGRDEQSDRRDRASEGAERRRHVRRPLVGRVAQRGQLKNIVDKFHVDESSLSLVLEGSAGIGKSILLRHTIELCREKSAPSFTCIIGRGNAIERDMPYHVWRRIFSQLLDVGGLRDGHEVKRRAKALLPTSLHRTLGMLNPVLEVALPDEGNQGRKPVQASRIQSYLAASFCALSGTGPLALFLEDAHYIDPSSWALLDAIRERHPSSLVAIAARPAALGQERRSELEEGWTQLSLGPMSQDSILRIARERLEVDNIPSSVEELIDNKAEGNPFFCEELVSALEASGRIYTSDGTCLVDEEVEVPDFPSTLDGLITSHVDRLSPSQQLTLKIASVFGRVFNSLALGDVMPRVGAHGTLEPLLRQLAELDFITVDGDRDSSTFSFKHAVAQDVTYKMMLIDQRRMLHEAIGDWYELRSGEESAFFGRITHHRREAATAGGGGPSEGQLNKAVEALTCSANHALGTGAMLEAETQFQQGVELLMRLPAGRKRDHAELLLRSGLGTALVATRGPTHDDVERQYRRAVELCEQLGDIEKLFESVFSLWYVHFVQGDVRSCARLSDRALKIAEKVDLPALRFLATQAVGATAIGAGEHERGLATMLKAMAIAEGVGGDQTALGRLRDPMTMVYFHCAWATCALGFPDRSLNYLRKSIALARELEHPLALTQTLALAAQVHGYRGESDKQATLANEALTLAREHAFPFWVVQAESALAKVAIERGDFQYALNKLEGAVEMSEREGAGMLVPLVFADLIDTLTQQGRFEEALGAVVKSKDFLERKRPMFGAPEIHRMEGELWRRRSDDERAQVCMQQALRVAGEQKAKIMELRAAMSLARLWQSQGTPLRGLEQLSELYHWFTEGRELRDLVSARALMKELALPETGSCEVPPPLEALRVHVVKRLEAELPAHLAYHNVEHTRDDVFVAALRLAKLEALSTEDTVVLGASALLHDMGQIEGPIEHEAQSIAYGRQLLPGFGFSDREIESISLTIEATKLPQTPQNELGRVLADADLDVLGRGDFFAKNAALRVEMERLGHRVAPKTWLENQIRFLETHEYLTDSARVLRASGKEQNLKEMRKRLSECQA